ncbi:hypothetical protein DFQ28_004242, partial [Apophysomyces sp. BC1034]
RKLKGRLKREHRDLKRLNKQLGEAVDEETIRRLEACAKEKYKPQRDGKQPAKRDEQGKGSAEESVVSVDISGIDGQGIEELMEAALEDIEEESEEAPMEVAKKEPNRRRLMRIQAITKKLLLSADIEDVQASDVAELWNDDDELLKDEVDAIVKIVNELRPYVPKGRLNGAIALR